jgi:hypothetical protein
MKLSINQPLIKNLNKPQTNEYDQPINLLINKNSYFQLSSQYYPYYSTLEYLGVIMDIIDLNQFSIAVGSPFENLILVLSTERFMILTKVPPPNYSFNLNNNNILINAS